MDSTTGSDPPLLHRLDTSPSVYTMSSTTNRAPLGNPKYGGALFLLPREIRDYVYRDLVKGHYLGPTRLPRYNSNGIDLVLNFVKPDFSILRVSKIIGSEAKETMYSESVFRLIISSDTFQDWVPRPDHDCMRNVVPLMKNVVLDVETWSLDMVDRMGQLEYDILIPILRGSDSRCQDLRVRMLGCSQFSLQGNKVANFCHQLKAIHGLRAVTVEVLPMYWMVDAHHYYYLDDPDKGRSTRQLVSRITRAVAKELEPAFGPAVSGFKSDTGHLPIPNCCTLSLEGISLVGFLNFHPGRHSVEKHVADEERRQ